jgi:hypothetical protein
VRFDDARGAHTLEDIANGFLCLERGPELLSGQAAFRMLMEHREDARAHLPGLPATFAL